MRDRATLHQNKHAEFVAWAKSKGWTQRPTAGEYEVLRLKHPTRNILAIYHQRLGTDHYTMFSDGHRLVRDWMGERATTQSDKGGE